MTGYDAMHDILDVNEILSELREKNIDRTPDLTSCKLNDLLVNYRELLIQELRATPLQVYSCGEYRKNKNQDSD